MLGDDASHAFTTLPKRLARMNLLIRGIAEVAAILFGVATTVWVSRTIGPSSFGQYAVMLAVVAIGSALVNAGLPNVGSQHVANEPEKVGEILWLLIVIRAAVAAIAIAVTLVVLAVAPIDLVLRRLLQVGILAWATQPLSSGWVLVAKGRSRAMAAIRLTTSLTSLAVALLIVRTASDVDHVAWVSVAGAVAGAVGTSLIALRLGPICPPVGDPVLVAMRAYVREGFHYMKSDVSAFVFQSSDRLFLYVFATPTVVGLYEAAYRVINPFYAISAVIHDVMYLQLAKAYGTDQLKASFRRYVDLMLVATIPLGSFLLAFAPTVVSILYGSKYEGAGDYLRVLGWVITIAYAAGIVVIPFTAWNRPKQYGNAMTLGGLVNLALNVSLIPFFGGLGAAWATIAANSAVAVAGLHYFRKATDYPVARDVLDYLIAAGAAYAVAQLATLATGQAVVGITLFGLTYVGLMWLIRWRSDGSRRLTSPSG